MTYLLIGFLAGAIAMGIAMLTWLSLRKPPSITMHARREHPVHRQYRDLPVADVPPPWERGEVGGIRYEHLGMTGEEV